MPEMLAEDLDSQSVASSGESLTPRAELIPSPAEVVSPSAQSFTPPAQVVTPRAGVVHRLVPRPTRGRGQDRFNRLVDLMDNLSQRMEDSPSISFLKSLNEFVVQVPESSQLEMCQALLKTVAAFIPKSTPSELPPAPSTTQYSNSHAPTYTFTPPPAPYTYFPHYPPSFYPPPPSSYQHEHYPTNTVPSCSQDTSHLSSPIHSFPHSPMHSI